MPKSAFLVEYQPHICFHGECLSGFEALVRWNHPTRGWICPTEFIPIAEDTGLIVPLGLWILKTACQQLKLWQMTFPSCTLKMSVNFSGKQLLQPDVVAQVSDILEETSLNAESLRLEITESVLINNLETAQSRLNQLSNIGIQLAIDDFGTGYSSLARLRDFKVNTLKIDQSFVRQMQAVDENTEIVRAIIELGHSLDMSVNAEGIEAVHQLSNLKKLGCDEGQGFLFSRPLAPLPATKFIADSTAGSPDATKLLEQLFQH